MRRNDRQVVDVPVLLPGQLGGKLNGKSNTPEICREIDTYLGQCSVAGWCLLLLWGHKGFTIGLMYHCILVCGLGGSTLTQVADPDPF